MTRNVTGLSAMCKTCHDASVYEKRKEKAAKAKEAKA